MDNSFRFNMIYGVENIKTGFNEEAGFRRLVFFFRNRIYMLRIVRMQLFSKKVKKREEKYEDYDHEAECDSNAIKHNDNSSLNCNYHFLVYMTLAEKISVELSILKMPNCRHGKSVRASRLPIYRRYPFLESQP